MGRDRIAWAANQPMELAQARWWCGRCRACSLSLISCTAAAAQRLRSSLAERFRLPRLILVTCITRARTGCW